MEDRAPISGSLSTGSIRALYDWLEPKTVEPKDVATVRVEPRTKRIPNNEPYKFQVVAMRLEPGGYSEAVAGGEVDIVLVTNRNFPSGKYDLEVVFGKEAPPELSGRLTNSLTGRQPNRPTPAMQVTTSHICFATSKTISIWHWRTRAPSRRPSLETGLRPAGRTTALSISALLRCSTGTGTVTLRIS